MEDVRIGSIFRKNLFPSRSVYFQLPYKIVMLQKFEEWRICAQATTRNTLESLGFNLVGHYYDNYTNLRELGSFSSNISNTALRNVGVILFIWSFEVVPVHLCFLSWFPKNSKWFSFDPGSQLSGRLYVVLPFFKYVKKFWFSQKQTSGISPISAHVNIFRWILSGVCREISDFSSGEVLMISGKFHQRR